MRLSRSSLCGILLEEGEEDLAVLIAQADLPEVLDSDRDAAALAALGLGSDDLAALLPAVSGDPVTGRRGRDELAQAVSERWAHLVSAWTVPPPAGSADG
ncbi:MAG TPA: hypothetical protein VFV73_45365 [Streptosporangiaceae bacterium]|nr:hypothetical protein [Streptosporangiaceae bacterium]